MPLAASIKEAEATLSPSHKIIGSEVAAPGAHPYLAGLIIELMNSGNSFCGSTLLTKNRLITAAHCWRTTGHQAWRLTVVLGSQRLYSGGIRIQTTQVVVHPNYNSQNLANDVGITYLQKNIRFSNRLRPAMLPSGSQVFETFAENWAIAAGYGKISDHTNANSLSQINEVRLLVISVEACRRWYGAIVQHSNICTSGKGLVGVCSGDSGGPLIVERNGQNVLVGVTSFAAATSTGTACESGAPSGYAKVTSFLDFIHQHL